MKIIIYTLLYILVASTAFGWSGTVVAVHDGDTLTVQSDDGTKHRVRIYGVDAPELKQPFGLEAKAMTERVVLGKTVEVIPAQKGRSYKREVAGIVMLDALVVLQDVLVSTGLAWVDGRFCKLQVCDLWRLHQQDAKEAVPPRGLWADEESIAPWTWRKMQKGKK